MTEQTISIEIAYALPERQRIIELDVAVGTRVYEAVKQSDILSMFPDIDLETAKMGIFGKAVKAESHVVEAGDRIEVYRPLLIDPKASRKARADKAKSAG